MWIDDKAQSFVEMFRPAEDFWKADLEEAIYNSSKVMIEYNMTSEDIEQVLRSLISAVSAEYGE